MVVADFMSTGIEFHALAAAMWNLLSPVIELSSLGMVRRLLSEDECKVRAGT